MQTKQRSLFEVSVNVAIGYLVSYASLYIIFPIFDIESSPRDKAFITLFFTVVSVIRGYLVRRYFNGRL